MTEMGTGKTIYHLKKEIERIQNELAQLATPASDIQELITPTNLLRANEHISKINHKQDELLSRYLQYSTAMEKLLASVFEIQVDLKDILKEQSSLISNTSKTKSKKK